jgi:hypothetical protein
MKFKELWEMTMRAGDLSHNLKPYLGRFVDQYEKYPDRFEHVGDIEHIKVLKTKEKHWFIYLLMADDIGVGYFEVFEYGASEDEPYKNSSLINVAYISEKFHGKSIFEKFIWFLKKHEKASKILIGDVHSAMMVPAIKKLSKKFDTNWVKKDEKVKYDPEKLDQHSSGSTGWLVMFENQSSFEGWPAFFNESSPDFRQRYDWLLED